MKYRDGFWRYYCPRCQFGAGCARSTASAWLWVASCVAAHAVKCRALRRGEAR